MAAVDRAATVSPVDVRLRVIKAALSPGIVLARVAALPLDDLEALVAVAYFEEARERGLSLRAIARRFGKSLRTIATLSKRASESGVLVEASRAIAVRRRLVEHLARATGTQNAEELCQSVPDVRANEVREQIQQLVDEGILTEVDGAYQVAAAHLPLLGDELDQRLESLRLLLSGATQTIYRRFFSVGGDGTALARVLVFSAVRDDLSALAERLYEALRSGAIALDAAAQGREDAKQSSCVLCVVERPEDPAWRSPR